jgi:hypothetical protein
MFGQDGRGARWTVVTTDAALVACALAAWDCGLEYELAPQEDSIAASLPGWPLPVAVAVPGVPDPHDPAEEEAGPALMPPDVTVWGPPQRRLGADEIAVHWHAWRDQLPPSLGPEPPDEAADDATDDAPAPGPRTVPATAGTGTEADENAAPAGGPAAGSAGTAPGAPSPDDAAAGGSEPREAGFPPDPGGGADPAEISHPGVRRALAEAGEYLRTPPPPGRVRNTAGALRADGPGWSLVARPDDIAFVLLDEAPGEVMPVGRGQALPQLLDSLGRLAEAPS